MDCVDTLPVINLKYCFSMCFRTWLSVVSLEPGDVQKPAWAPTPENPTDALYYSVRTEGERRLRPRLLPFS